MTNLDGRITILFSDHGLEIEIEDNKSGLTFVRAKLNGEQTLQALSRLAYTHCNLEVRGLDKVGLTHECKQFEFQLPQGGEDWDKREKLAIISAQKRCPKGWEPDFYFMNKKG